MNDPYLNRERCINRLYNEYKRHGKLLIACDHDDTVYDYHKKGYKYPRLLDLLKKCQELGFYIVVFTGTPKEKYPEIEKYWKENLGINITGINKNAVPLPMGNDGKIYFNILLDDRAGLSEACEILWQVILKIVMKKFWKNAKRK